MSKYKDAIVSCPAGFAPVLQEYADRGLTKYISHTEAGTPILSRKLNPLYPTVLDYNTPALVYLRGLSVDIDLLASIQWTSCKVLAVAPYAEDVYTAMGSDETAEYMSYQDGVYPATTVDVDGIVIPHPKAGEMRKIVVIA